MDWVFGRHSPSAATAKITRRSRFVERPKRSILANVGRSAKTPLQDDCPLQHQPFARIPTSMIDYASGSPPAERSDPASCPTGLGVNFQEVVHSAPAVNADIAKRQ
jgi:hypothetical protein